MDSQTSSIRKKSFDTDKMKVTSASAPVHVKAEEGTHIHAGGQNIKVIMPHKIAALQMNVGGGNLDVRDISAAVSATVGGGQVSMEDISGDLRVSCHSGNAVLKRIDSSDVDIESKGGNSHLDMSDLEKGLIRMRSVGGSLALQVPPDASLSISAEAEHGSIACDLPLADGETPRESGWTTVLNGTLGDGTATAELRSHTGSVHIKARQPKVADADVEESGESTEETTQNKEKNV